MPNNSSDEISKKLYEDYEDSLFRLVIHDTANKEGKLFLEEKEKLKNDPKSYPSKEVSQKFCQQLDARLKKPKTYKARQLMLRRFNRTAVEILFVVVILLTTVASVQALRTKVLNFFMDIQPGYTSFQLKENDKSTNKETPVVNWTNAYVPTYIPDGYIVKTSA